ncbi:hypothetical protein HDU91_004995 [Kappamyces sp. JEL0680]|nr:hypothetical protein HDU91_004995 [Kappamyces sp. JEL0680]
MSADDEFDSTDSVIRYMAYASRLTRFSRYLAFTSDVGEAVRPIVSRGVVNLAYGISFGYVAWDIGYEAWKSKKRQDPPSLTTRVVLERTAFQGLASLLLPAVTIHTIVAQSTKQFKRMAVHPTLLRWGPSALGLATLPALPIVFDEPVEHGMEQLMDVIWPLSPADKARTKHHHHKSE